MVSVKSTSQPIDLDAFCDWVATQAEKFTDDQVRRAPRLVMAAQRYAAQWRDDKNPFMTDMAFRAMSGQFFTTAQARGVLNIARATEQRKRWHNRAPSSAASIYQTQHAADMAARAAASEHALVIGRTVGADILGKVKAMRETYAQADARNAAKWDTTYSSAPQPFVPATQEDVEREAECRNEVVLEFGHGHYTPTPMTAEERIDEARYSASDDVREEELGALYDHLHPATPVAMTLSKKIPNATYTVVFDPARDDRITLRIYVPTTKWVPAGEQTVAMLRGSDNESDYTKVAYIVERNGCYTVNFQRYVSEQQRERLRSAFNIINGDQDAAREAYAVQSGKCARCGRKLTVPASIHRGLGPVCAEKAW